MCITVAAVIIYIIRSESVFLPCYDMYSELLCSSVVIRFIVLPKP